MAKPNIGKVRRISPRETVTAHGGRQLSTKMGVDLNSAKKKKESVEGELVPSPYKNTTPFKLKEDDADDFISRTNGILKRMDEERARNPLSEDSNISYEFYKATLAETLEMVPKAKQAYMRTINQSNAYAYNALVTKCQELLADMQALDDRGSLLEKLLESSITPSFLALINNLSNTYTESLESIKQMGLSERDTEKVITLMRDTIRKLGSHTQEVSKGLQSEILGMMGNEE